MEVLTKILQQGTEFETLAETALADRLVSRFQKIVCFRHGSLSYDAENNRPYLYLVIPDLRD